MGVKDSLVRTVNGFSIAAFGESLENYVVLENHNNNTLLKTSDNLQTWARNPYKHILVHEYYIRWIKLHLEQTWSTCPASRQKPIATE